ncbi:MAG: LptF/LptG family permease, partial [Planctomycetota bacterium]
MRAGRAWDEPTPMRTLHWYILRELLKTFALTVVALSVLFTMGGGLYNVMRYEGITPGDLFSVMPMLLPIVITLMMPIAALFSVTILYGRLAADNELTACRAAGINVHRLFLAAVVLAVGVTAFSLFATNLVIPRFMQQIEYFARSNIRNIVFNKIRQSGFVRYLN